MRMTTLLSVGLIAGQVACAHAATPTPDTPAVSAAGAVPQSGSPGPSSTFNGRFQLVVVPGHPGSPFLIDTMSGCIWHQVQNQDTKRTTFVEVDVENLHWSWGSGAQQLLAGRIDAANLTDEQKRALKDNLQRTACGLTSVVLTPGLRPGGGLPSSQPSAPAPPK
ncbi:MAG: hypothetical protein ACREIS_11680 [Nitrospiraceae bacterium]